MREEGFESVYVLQGGLQAWQQAGYPLVPIQSDQEAESGLAPTVTITAASAAANSTATHTHTFLPGLVENYVNKQTLPTQKELTILFVDIADSTTTVVGKSPEEALEFVQRFMGIVTDAALAYCGDVKDYEGDGALLYFESVAEAAQAALSIRDTLARQQAEGQTPLHARFSLSVGDIVIGVIGTPLRRSVALIGPSINLAARLLKQIPPGGIIATKSVVEHLHQEAPPLAERFALWNEKLELKGFEQEYVTAYSIN